MTEMITRCPKCATAFRISEVHLKSAKGVVRCGSCLNIFDARAHIESPKSKPITQAKPASDSNKKPKPEPKEATNTTVEPPPPKKSSRIQPTDEPHSDMDEFSLFDATPASSEAEEHPDEDESWALELLKEEGHPVETSTPPKQTAKPNKEKARANPKREEHAESSPKASTPKKIKQEPEPARVKESTLAPKKAKALKPAKNEEPDFNKVLAAIEPDPVEVEWDGDSSKGRKALWLVGSLAAALLLITQIAWLGFHRFNKEQPYRSFYQVACGLIGCELPPLQDYNKITASNLIVRSHPEYTNALQVDVILQNSANFEQPFPNVVLEFSDSRNKPIFARKFAPDEYLGGELSGRKMMPIKHPIHIAFEIKDPGESAVSYQILISK